MRLHYYWYLGDELAPTVWSESNMDLFGRHVVPAQVIFQLWQQRKMYTKACKVELFKSRAINVENFLKGERDS